MSFVSTSQFINWNYPSSLAIPDIEPFIPYDLHAFSLYYSLYIYWGADKENLLNNQELLWLVIISFILFTLMFD